MPSRSTGDQEDYNGLKRRWDDIVALIAKRTITAPPAGVPIWIFVEWHEPDRRRDKDNIRSAMKFLLDGIVKSGKLPNDGNGVIAGFDGDCFLYPGNEKYRGPGVVVFLHTVPPQWALLRGATESIEEWWAVLRIDARMPDYNEMSAAREYGARKHVYRARAKGANQWR